MAIPSHALVMAAANTLQLIEIRDGYKTARQAHDLLDTLIASNLLELNATAERRTRNEMQHCLRMLLRRDARNAGVLLPCLEA
jgi:hypothetical protein